MYSLLMVTLEGILEEIAKGKGVPKRVLKKQTEHANYLAMIYAPYHSVANSSAMRSHKQNNIVLELEKRMLTAFNDKVYQLDWDSSRPLGHFRNF